MRNNNLILNRLFTQSVFNKLIKEQKSKLFESVAKRYINIEPNEKNAQIINKIYYHLSEHYRNEYFYKNTLLNKLLLGRHSVNTTTALTQLPIGKAKADFVLINGNAVVYEIKTELDSLERLNSQIKNYYKAFNTVYVVTAEKYYSRLIKMFEKNKVGICVLLRKGKGNFVLQFRKNAGVLNKYLNHETIFKLLRKKEFEKIILEYYKELPKAAPVFYYDECFRYFKKIPIEEAYNKLLQELKRRSKVKKEYLNSVPYELKALMYFSYNLKREYDLLNEFLEKPYRGR